MKLRIIVAICSLLAGVVFSYLGAYLVYTPRIDSLATQVASLEAEVTFLDAEATSLEAEATSLEAEVTSLGQIISEQVDEISTQQGTVSARDTTISEQQTSISALELANTNLQVDLSQSQTQIGNYREQVNTQQSQLLDLKESLDEVLAITVIQNYTWKYQRQTRSAEFPIQLSTYFEFWDRRRPIEPSAWVDMAKDPSDDLYIDYVIQGLNEFALERRLTEAQKLNYIITFVQSLPYTVDSVTSPYDEYPRYPVETLFDRGGDCEDTSILVAALLDAMDYDVALLALEGHMAVGIVRPNGLGTYYEYDGKRYYYIETTAGGWQIGDFPPSITDPTAYVYPLRS